MIGSAVVVYVMRRKLVGRSADHQPYMHALCDASSTDRPHKQQVIILVFFLFSFFCIVC